MPNQNSTPNYILVAVSQTGDPTGSWYRYGFEFPDFPDYPKYGVWPDGYYVSANHFFSSGVGTSNAVFERDAMLNGAPAQMVLFNTSGSISWSLLPSDWNGTNTPPAGAPNYFGQIHDNADYGGSDGFDIFQFHVDWTTPSNSSFTGPTFIPVNAFSQVSGISQPGSYQPLDDLSDRVMNRFDYRNFESYQSMVTCHTVDAGSGRAGIRWYEFRNTGGGWTLFQQGTYAPADGLNRWMGSVAINDNGDIALGYSVSGSSVYPGIRYTGRHSGDTPGVMTIPEETIQNGNGSQTASPRNRWGDYTQMVVDPSNNDFWYVNEYLPNTGSFNWKTRIASFTFGPPCPIDLASSPGPADGTNDVSITQTLNWINGTGATQCEVWFGEPGSVVKVYDGSLISSWGPPGTFNYITTYNWRIVGKNGTCSVAGPTWSFTTEQSPDVIYSEYFDNLNCWTAIGPMGTSNWSLSSTSNAGGVSPELDFNWSPQFDGLSKFVSCAIPVAASHNYSINLKHFIDWYTDPAPILGLGISYDNGTTYTEIWSTQPTGNVGPEDITASFTTSAGASDIYLVLFNNGNSFNIDDWFMDNIVLTDDEFFNVSDPTDVSASALSPTQIDISFIPNAGNNNVVIVWNQTGVFTDPSGAPPSVGQPFAGGTLLYNGTTSPVHHTNLNPSTTYYYKLFSYDGSAYSIGVSTSAVTNSVQTDFSVNLLIHDICSNSISLTFGTASTATDCYDDGLDVYAPPPPPGGAFDGRFVSCNEGLFTDYKSTNINGERTWDIYYQPAESCSPVTIEWNPADFPTEGNFHLVDAITGNLVNVNMRTRSSFSDSVNIGHLQIIYNFEICAPYNIGSSWNLLSLPVDVSDPDYLILFPNANQGTLYGYAEGYFTSDSLTPGSGYWLKFNSSENTEVCGSDRTECVLDLSEGWNLIGGPNCNLSVSDIIDPGNIIIPGTIYGYSGGYFNATSIDAGKGYWLKTNAAGTVTLNCFSPSNLNGPKLLISSEVLSNFITVNIADNDKKDQTLFFNGTLPDDLSADNFSMPPLPPQGAFDARLSGDTRLSEGGSVSIKVQTTSYPLKVKFIFPAGKDKAGYIMEELIEGIITNSHKVESQDEIVISNPKVSLLKIHNKEDVPLKYNLAQNYPNPFNPSTAIKFTLPEAANVKLTIYNSLGQRITELVNSQLEAGRYSFEWDASKVATGVYIYELRAGSFISVKKMMLLK